MKHISLILLLALLLPFSVLAQHSPPVRAEAIAATEVQAIDQAKRAAVEKSIGTVVSSQTLTQNFQLAKDNIFSRAAGFLKSYKLISSQEVDGGWLVVIEAEVTAIFDDLLQDQVAFDQLLMWLDKPRFMIIIDESNVGELSNNCETEIARLMAEKNFNLISSSKGAEAVRSKMSGSGDGEVTNEAIAYASGAGAEMLVLGKGTAKVAIGVAALERSGLKSVQSEISAQIIDVRDGSIWASYSTHGAAVHISPTTAGVNAFAKASAMMVDSLSALLLKHGSKAQLQARQITLSVNGVSFMTLNKMLAKLRDVPGVSNVSQRSFQAPVAVIGVEYFGGAMELGMEIEGMPIAGQVVQVSGVEGNSLSAELVKN